MAANEGGWSPLSGTDAYYRWEHGERVEVHLIYDGAGRLEAWSVWRNKRVRLPDQEAGRRDRLNAYLAGCEE
jgi:hypothetical protein